MINKCNKGFFMKFTRSLLLFSLCLNLFLEPFLAASSSSESSSDHKRKSKNSRADYVIIGVGTAGAVLAKQLSDDHKTSVIALHSGENLSQDPEIKFTKNTITTVVSAILGVPFFSEVGETTPQTDADNRTMPWVLAQPLGGASSINAGAYCRGTNQDFAQWEAIAGPDWSVKRILKLYKQLETYDGKTNNPAARGSRGPINVRQEPRPSKVALTFTQATINATGFPFVLDYNDPTTPIGVSSQFQYTQKGPNGSLRVSSNTAFLNRKVMTSSGKGVFGRKLKVFFEATALRTIWKGNKAVGVEYLKNGVVKRVFANKGVIVSAGLFSSAFLMHSGVGPKATLESLGIPVVYDNPNVGQSLTDQPHVIVSFSSNPADTPVPSRSNGAFSQIAWLPAPGGDPGVRAIRIATINQTPGIVLAFIDLDQAKSRGSITLNSADPLVPPVINEGALTNPDDLNLYISAFQVYIKGINNALQAIDPAYKLIFPDPSIIDDTVALTNFIKEEIDPNQHFQSHCRMAPLDQGGVVDSSGHVYGVQNLIVADNSINPIGMDGSPMATGFLVGANIARILIRDGNK